MKGKFVFTMIDLLVTLAIIGLIASIIWPVVSSTRRKGRVTACASQLRQQYHAAVAFAEDRERLPVYGDGTAYMDVLEGQEVDGDFGQFLRQYAGVDTVAEGQIDGTASTQLAIGDWSSSVLRCPAAAQPTTWWFGKYHHAMAPWEVIDYRLAGLNTLSGPGSLFGDRRLAAIGDPQRVLFSQDHTLAASAAQMSDIFGAARHNNHQYRGLNAMSFAGSVAWLEPRATVSLQSLGDLDGGYYRTSHPVDGEVSWWTSEAHLLPTPYYSSSTGYRVYAPQPHGIGLSSYVYAPEADYSERDRLAENAAALGYDLAPRPVADPGPDASSGDADRRRRVD